MKKHVGVMIGLALALWATGRAWSQDEDSREIKPINPPERGFFTKVLSFHGILIKAPDVVSNEALQAAYDRLALETKHLPMVITNLAAAGAELHIIGRNQVTTDLPEWRQDKHVPLDEYNGLTRDQRTRGMGGLTTSCGEENLLNLPTDRYRGRDICLHEFAHNIEGSGIPRSVRAVFDAQYQKSLDQGLWLNSYAGSNPSEYFAELTMWYFGTHGDLTMTGPKPGNGPEGLKQYDPDAYELFDKFYSGQMPIDKVEPRFGRRGNGTNTNSSTNTFTQRQPRDSQPARTLVAKLTSYQVGTTTLAAFYADAGMSGPADTGTNGWSVNQLTNSAADGRSQFHVMFLDPRPPNARGRGPNGGARANSGNTNTVSTTNAVATNAATTNATAARAGGGAGRGRRGGPPAIADLDFDKNGVLSKFTWDN